MRRLKTSEDIRRFCAWCIDQVEKDKMVMSKGLALTLMAHRALRAIEIGNNAIVDSLIEEIQQEIGE
jgi:hypothetical protein